MVIRERQIVKLNSSLILLTVLLATTAFALADEAPQPAGDASRVVLRDTTTPWRMFMGYSTIEVLGADGKIGPLAEGGKGEEKPKPMVRSSRPPADWTAVDFDDHLWSRTQGPFGMNAWTRGYTDLWGRGSPGEISLVCLRGRFVVTDPEGAGQVRIFVDYYGGAVVYVNGKELGRANLPDGRLDYETPADPYPDKAYLRPDGKLLNEGDAKNFPEPYAARHRTLEVKIPRTALRKGLNLVAIEVHRAPLNHIRLERPVGDQNYQGPPTPWPHAKIVRAEITADPGATVEPDTARPPGIRVWNHPKILRLSVTDLPDALEKVSPIRMAGARNGVFNGLVVVSSDEAITGLSAKLDAFKSADGAGLPALAGRVFYLRPDGPQHNTYQPPPAWFDGLADAVPAEVAVDPRAKAATQPIWVQVRVPADATAGDYAATLTVQADGLEPTPVPVRLKVHEYLLADPKDYVTHVGLIQSPDMLARQYKVEMWSPEHWKLIDRSFERMAEVGGKDIYLPLLRRTHFGNAQSMVRWIHDGQGWRCDFSIVDRYLDTAVKRLGKVPMVCCYVWERYTGQQYLDTRTVRDASSGMLYTQLDATTGALTDAEGPRWSDPEVKEFWKPALEGIRKRLADRGMEKSMMIGMAGDMRPTRDVVMVLKEIAPDLPWVIQAHPRSTDLYGQPAGYVSNVWPSAEAPDPEVRRLYGWKGGKWIDVTFPREGSKCIGSMRPWSAPLVDRSICEAVVTAGMKGIGRVGADFWPIGTARGATQTLFGFYPSSDWAQLTVDNSSAAIFWPGPDGAAMTVRAEMLREGLQLVEARATIERALSDPALRAKLGGDLADRAQDLLDRRVHALKAAAKADGAIASGYFTAFNSGGWQDRDDELFELAARVAAGLAAK
ncbi:MAG: hypothetical protein BIFFINMI_02304 [Phycisphaerae bacterium]|nr:hypothetical protein [Phycisphaerae bacterium]